MDKVFSWFISGQINVLSFVMSAAAMAVVAMLWSSRGRLSCIDLITGKDGKLSRVAIGECMGVLITVVVPVWQTVQGKIDADIFATCLIYLGGSSGLAKYLRWKSDLVNSTGPQKDMPSGTP